MDTIMKSVKENNIQGFNPSQVRKAKTTFQFDDEFTLKLLAPGEPQSNYYDKLSCSEDVKNVDLPMLFIHSKNDPICL